MTSKIFATPEDAERAFYDALERADLEAMSAVWADDEDVLCVHPAGARLCGTAEVLAGWKQMFASGQRLRVHLTQRVAITGVMVVVHSVQENISVEGEGPAPHPVVATNVYQRTGAGWRMIVHHASPAPGPVEQVAAPAGALTAGPGNALLH